MIPLRVFVVDDEDSVRVSLADDLREAGYRVHEFADAASTFAAVRTVGVDVVITDIQMPGMNGMELLQRVKQLEPEVVVVMMTAYGSIESAVQAIKLGAYDYVTKPFETDEILLMLERIQELRSLKNVTTQLQTEREAMFDSTALVAASPAMREVLAQLHLIRTSNTTVLIVGETGTGKELLANIIHYNSPRKARPLITVNCAMLSREMFESELFGHEKGAFTGAYKEKRGRFELAHGGTLYLDDVDDIPFDLQVKLLRALEQQEFERVGGTETLRVDVRVIASTKADLKKLAAEGKFREDLFYRLNVFPLRLKPLRERREDIRPLMDYWLRHYAQGRALRVEPDVYTVLENYPFPGNVRELKNLMERLVLLASADGVIDVGKLPLEVCSGSAASASITLEKPLEQTLAEIEVHTIRAVLTKCGGNKAQAAKLLGLPPSTLRTKMEKYGIS